LSLLLYLKDKDITKTFCGEAADVYVQHQGNKGVKKMVATNRPMSSIGFKLMSLMFKVRDILRPRLDVLKEAGVWGTSLKNSIDERSILRQKGMMPRQAGLEAPGALHHVMISGIEWVPSLNECMELQKIERRKVYVESTVFGRSYQRRRSHAEGYVAQFR
jgi:hypothetical protein